MGTERKVIRQTICFALLAFFASSSCAATGSNHRIRVDHDSTPQKIIRVDMNSNGKQIEARVADEIQIELEGIGATGYWWYFGRLDRDHFELMSEETVTVREGVTGGPVLGVWRLRAKTPRLSIIKMDYYRIWEGKDKADKHFEIEVNITP